jgi:hypothetical protein
LTDLDVALDRLGRTIEWPETPELAAAVRARLAPRRRILERPVVVVAVAVAAIAAAGVLAASESARSALLELLHIPGVEISYAEELPAVRFRLGEDTLGRRVSLTGAEELTPFELLVPTLDGLDEPDRVYYRESPPGDMVTLVYEVDGGNARLLLSQWYGSTAPFFYKVLTGDTPARRVGVGAVPGLWISGGLHVVATFSYRSPDGEYRQESPALAGNVLLWEDLGVSYRLEADVPLREALKIARSLRWEGTAAHHGLGRRGRRRLRERPRAGSPRRRRPGDGRRPRTGRIAAVSHCSTPVTSPLDSAAGGRTGGRAVWPE